MRKVFILLVVICCFCSVSFAQTSGKFEFGVGTGFNAAYAQDSYTGANSDALYGFNFGISGDYYFSNRWSLRAKILYDEKGWGNGYLINSDGSETNGLNFQMNYLTMPVMASWHFGRMKNLYIDFGPYIGVLLSANETNDNANVKPYFNNTDFGFDFGIGAKFPVSKNVKFFVEGEAQAGVLNVFKQGDGSAIQSERSSINIGFDFPMGQ
jgi:hypothetical protein